MAPKPRILAGCSVKQDEHVFVAAVKTLQWQDADVELDFAFVDDGNDYDLTDHFDDGSCFVIGGEPRPEEVEYSIGDRTHHWSIPTFHRLARAKQRLIDHAITGDYDYFWLVDSDLLLDPCTLRSALALDVEVCNSVFYTDWQKGSDPLPQVWLRHPYELSGMGKSTDEFLRCMAERRATRVVGGGACTLFKLDSLKRSGGYFPLVPGLPSHGMWQGEDRHLAVKLTNARVAQWADAWPDIYHAYHPEDRTEEALEAALEVLQPQMLDEWGYGDLVNFRLRSLDDESLPVASIRGRIGGLKLLPELEAELLEMDPGEKRLVQMHFPMWAPRLPKQIRMIEITIVDKKYYGYAPKLAKAAFAGLS